METEDGGEDATFFLLEAFIFAYKGEPPPSRSSCPRSPALSAAVPAVLLLPYPLGNLLLDVLLLLLYLGVEAARIFFGSEGNLCQRKVPLAASLALTVPAAVMATYCLLLQTYALRLEAVLSAVLLLFYAVELLLGSLALAAFSR
ncbi:hypothetical protein ASZ78_010146 [Callipepla squamata]|uniref:Transmembrane protein 216 n=1 Tax=Callipepla squamata TaxID=9009 RepID=A0A226MQ81_CALSU|nr:hypothetical protein ASZ78_010146 [Callipepla squamata]